MSVRSALVMCSQRDFGSLYARVYIILCPIGLIALVLVEKSAGAARLADISTLRPSTTPRRIGQVSPVDLSQI